MVWKNVAYMGYYFNSDTFIPNIQKLVNAGATHILFEFIQMDYSEDVVVPANSYYYLKLYDTVFYWTDYWNSLSDDEKQNIYNILGDTILGFSFGGAGSFSQYNLYSAIGLKYQLYETETIGTLTPLNLGADLYAICNNSNITYIDLDIEYINECVYKDSIFTTMLNFLGDLSINLKKSGMIVSHAPQTPYFNNATFGFIYNQLDFQYGSNIDFYNMQYYNVSDGAYQTYNSLFYEDGDQFGSILQIINSYNTIIENYGSTYDIDDFNIEISKIVLGKCVSGEGSDDNYVILYDESATATNPSMTYFLNITYGYENPGDDSNYPVSLTETQTAQLNDWILNAGAMVWLYLNDNTDKQNELLNYFLYNKGGACFVLGTKILCYQNHNEIEINIELLQNGDYVKTHTGEYKKIVYIGYNFYKNNFKNKIKVIKKNKISLNIPNDDLYLTSGHSLLFNDLKYTNAFYNENHYPENEKIGDYYKIMTSQCYLCDDYDKNKNIEFYFHIVLENENLDGQYGVYANGVLCESMSYNYIEKAGLKEYKN